METPARQEADGEAVAAFVERFAADLTEAGIPRMSSRIFACLLAEADGVLTAAQLAERLSASPAAVSGAVRYLAQQHMLSREREPGSRRERYRLHADIWHEVVAGRDKVFARWSATMRAGVKAVGEDTAAGRRLAEAAEFFDFAKDELAAMVDRWYRSRALTRENQV
ncbi:GbsR/MarR family transcriptional regulator [Streptomyces sp. NPDC020490]|uniref:GbsR/MarR family transcriptional regulator n=1 Tax=Streptomyces sp. NPDC020490 TaxID=3365078 RepID=UPI00379E0BC1